MGLVIDFAENDADTIGRREFTSGEGVGREGLGQRMTGNQNRTRPGKRFKRCPWIIRIESSQEISLSSELLIVDPLNTVRKLHITQPSHTHPSAPKLNERTKIILSHYITTIDFHSSPSQSSMFVPLDRKIFKSTLPANPSSFPQIDHAPPPNQTSPGSDMRNDT